MTSLHNGPRFTIENNVLKGEVVEYDESSYINFGEFVLGTLEDSPDSVGQIDAISGEERNFGKMRDRSVRCALWMKSQGLRPKDVVVLCSEKCLDYAIPCFGALYLGAIFNPWDVTMTTDELRHVMNMAKPQMAFVSEGMAAVLADIAKEAGLDLKIIVFGRVPGFLEFGSVIAEPKRDEVEKFRCTSIESAEEIAMILLSSGTSGLQKGVALSHRALRICTRPKVARRSGDNVLSHFAAPHWLSSVNGLFDPLRLRMSALILPPFEEHSACAFIEKYKGNWVYFTPCMINRLLKSDAVGRHDLSSVNTIFYFGAGLSVESHTTLQKLLPHVHITSDYGMTECGGFISVQSTNAQLGSCGHVAPNAQVKVVDPDTGRTLGANEKGELLLKSAAMMSFYYNNPEATAQTIDEEGWVHSGDLGYYDENGKIFFIDRIKDIIRCGDDDISPSEIEDVISSLPGVKEVAVVNQPRPRDDDRLIAFVVRTENSSDKNKQVTGKDIVNIVAAKLPANRKLGAGVKFIDRLPRTSTDKIRRIELRNLAKSLAEV